MTAQQATAFNKQHGQKEKDVPRVVKAFISYGASFFHDIPLAHEGQHNIIEDQFCLLTQSRCSRDPYQAVRAVGDPL